MRKAILILTVFLLLTGFGSTEARADWLSDSINELVVKIRDIYARVRTIYTRTSGLPGMASTLAEARTELASGTPVRDLVELARDEVTQLAEAEAQRLIAFVNSTEPETVRLTLEGLVRDLRDVTNAQLDLLSCLDLPCGPPSIQYVTYERLLDAIQIAPASALYPIYRAQNVLDRLGNLGEILACLKDQLVEHKSLLCDVLGEESSPEAVVNQPEKMTALRNVHRALKVAEFLSKNVGSAMQSAAKSFDMQFEVAIWGWVGLSIDSDALEAMGKRLEGAAPTLQGLAAWLLKRVNHMELAAYQEAVIANQQLILDQLSAPGRGGGLREILRRRR